MLERCFRALRSIQTESCAVQRNIADLPRPTYPLHSHCSNKSHLSQLNIYLADEFLRRTPNNSSASRSPRYLLFDNLKHVLGCHWLCQRLWFRVCRRGEVDGCAIVARCALRSLLPAPCKQPGPFGAYLAPSQKHAVFD